MMSETDTGSESVEKIDLTRDDGDLEDILEATNNTKNTQKSEKMSKSQDPSALSILDTLRSIQEENPHIETIFIESDEEEEEAKHVPIRPVINVQEMQTVSSPFRVIPNTIKPKTPIQPPKSNFVVKEVTPSMLPSNLKMSATIALHEDSASPGSKRYLVIPNEVLPLLAMSKGPVSLNVPGIGPVLIPKPSEILKTAALVQGIKSTKEKKPEPTPKPYDPLGDPKFDCWKYRRLLKRDLEGYTLYDRLGFYKAEQKRSDTCIWKIRSKIEALQCSLQKSKLALQCIKRKKEEINPGYVKVVAIDKLKKSQRKSLHKPRNSLELEDGKSKDTKGNFKVKEEQLNPVQKKNLELLMAWKQHFQKGQQESSSDSDSNGENDLLVTKKVVVLKDTPRQRGGRTKIGTVHPYKQKTKGNTRHSYGKLGSLSTKGKRGRPRKIGSVSSLEEDNWASPKRGRPKKEMKPVKTEMVKKRGRPRKINKHESDEEYNEEKLLHDVKPCYVDLSPVRVKTQLESEVIKESTTHIISSLGEFQKEMDSGKPLLVVDRKQCEKLNLIEMCSTNNIVFPTTDTSDFERAFLISAEVCNVKFVKPGVLGSYLAGQRVPI